MDTDGGLDDFVALEMLSRCPSVALSCVTAVSGMAKDTSGTVAVAQRIITAGQPGADVEYGASDVDCVALEPAPAWLQEQRVTLSRMAAGSSSSSSSSSSSTLSTTTTTAPTALEAAVRFLRRLAETGDTCRLLALGPLTTVAAVMAAEPALFAATVARPQRLSQPGSTNGPYAGSGPPAQRALPDRRPPSSHSAAKIQIHLCPAKNQM